jgi:hypothetical protein
VACVYPNQRHPRGPLDRISPACADKKRVGTRIVVSHFTHYLDANLELESLQEQRTLTADRHVSAHSVCSVDSVCCVVC